MGMFDKIKTGLEEAVAYERGRYEQRRPSYPSCLWTITKLMRSGRFGKARDLPRLFLHSIWVSV